MRLRAQSCFAVAVGWGIAACALLPRAPTGLPGRTAVEFQDPRFDGQYLRGRLLIGAVSGEIAVPEKVEAHTTVIVDDLVECGTNRRLGLIHLCPVALKEPLPTRALHEGHWYGADIELEVRDRSQLSEILPECVEVKLTYVPPFWPPAEPQPERFSVRVSPSILVPDGGTAEDSGSPSLDTDGGH